jgi:hypothetical protein
MYSFKVVDQLHGLGVFQVAFEFRVCSLLATCSDSLMNMPRVIVFESSAWICEFQNCLA